MNLPGLFGLLELQIQNHNRKENMKLKLTAENIKEALDNQEIVQLVGQFLAKVGREVDHAHALERAEFRKEKLQMEINLLKEEIDFEKKNKGEKTYSYDRRRMRELENELILLEKYGRVY